MVIQASPDAPAESLFLTPNQVNQSSFNYGNYLGYFKAYTGNMQVQLVNYGSSTVIAADSIHLTANYTIRCSWQIPIPSPTLYYLQIP